MSSACAAREERPLVSVVIPTYYRNDRLRTAIESALNQTYDPIEVIVVDDSGEGFARPAVQQYDVSFVEHSENLGGNPARNTGYEESCGEYVQFLDDDDVLLADKIGKQVRLLQTEDGVGVAHCGFVWENGEEVVPADTHDTDVLEMALSFQLSNCTTSTLLIREQLLDDVCPLRSRPGSDDAGLKIELARRSEFRYLDSPLVVRADELFSRGSTPEAASEYFTIVDEYEELYDAYDDEVRRRAREIAYRRLGNARLRQRLWTVGATYAFWRAFSESGYRDVRAFGLFLSSFGGRLGTRFAESAWKTFS